MYPGPARRSTRRPAGGHHGGVRRDRHLSRTRSAQQSARASFARLGLKRLDHYAIFMENHPRFVECCAAGERSGLYYTAINSFLTAGELAYIVNNSLLEGAHHLARRSATSHWRRSPIVPASNSVSSSMGRARARACAISAMRPLSFPLTPIADETLGAAMLYSSGTTGRPKGVLRPLPDQPPAQMLNRPRRAFENVAVSRRPDLPLACASLPRRALGRCLGTIRLRRDGRRHGAIRPGTIPGARREIPRHPHPARADHVLADAEAARRHAPGL